MSALDGHSSSSADKSQSFDNTSAPVSGSSSSAPQNPRFPSIPATTRAAADTATAPEAESLRARPPEIRLGDDILVTSRDHVEDSTQDTGRQTANGIAAPSASESPLLTQASSASPRATSATTSARGIMATAMPHTPAAAAPSPLTTGARQHFARDQSMPAYPEDLVQSPNGRSRPFHSDRTIAVDPVALVTTECITVTSAMRKHARWAQSSVAAILGGGSSTASASPVVHRPRTAAMVATGSRSNSVSAAAAATAGSTTSTSGTGPHSSLTAPSRTSSPAPSATSYGRMSNGSLSGVDDDASLASRWGLRGKKGKSLADNPLMSAFARLRNELRACSDIHTFDTPTLLHPFLQVIRSSSTSAPITSLALIAITKFFAYNLITQASPRLGLAMHLLSAAITHCRFEASDSAADEVVLLRILKLMEGILAGPGGDLLSDESVCEMMETGLSMCCQARLSEVLRRSAEMAMVSMCQTVFERLKYLEDEVGGDVTAFEATGAGVTGEALRMGAPLKASAAPLPSPSRKDSVKNDVSTLAPAADSPRFPDGHSAPKSSSDDLTRPSSSAMEHQPNGDEVSAKSASNGAVTPNASAKQAIASSDDVADIKPYSLPSIRELFRVLVNLLDPHDRQHTDVMRIMALRIIDVALEVAGPSIARHPSLASLAEDSLCRNLFQLVRSDNMSLLNESLRVAGTLLATCRSVLKLQQELFLSYLVTCLHPRMDIPREEGIDPKLYEGVPQAPKGAKKPSSGSGSGRSTPVPVKDRQKLGMEGGVRKPDAREAMVECIGALARIPSFLAELFVNYDCEVDRGDLCEDFIGLLSRSAFPDAAIWSTTNVPPLCLNALLSYVQFVAERLDDETILEGYPDREVLRQQRARKKIIVKGAARFNEKPDAGIAYLASQGIIADPKDPHCVAGFLKGTTRVSKKVLGEYLAKKSNEVLLAAFLDLFNFNDKRVDEALREMLVAFRLPGESPLIERIVTVFCEKYCANSTPEGIADKDAVFVLTYAIIMLNTDQHNPNVKAQNRMTHEAFAKNLRGVNGGKDFAPEYLQVIYDEIKSNEIILPDEHDNQHAFDYAWRELLLKAQNSGDLVLCPTNAFDADMFAATWQPVVATLAYVFMSASEDAVYQRVVAGFEQCAQIAAQYGLTDTMDQIIYCLSSISTLAVAKPPSTTLNTEMQAGDRTIMVSEVAVKFGRDYRAQLATVVLFRGVVMNHESCIQDGWKHIVRVWINLFLNSLVPAKVPESDIIRDLPAVPVQPPSQVINREERANGTGLFQSFTSYLSSYAADEPAEPSTEEMNDTLCTYDCLRACPMEQILSHIRSLPPFSLAAFVTALLDHLPQKENAPVVAIIKGESGSPQPGKASQLHRSGNGPIYDPTTIYILELAAIAAIENPECPDAIGQDVLDALQNVIRDARNFHSLIVSRSSYYLFHLLRSKHDRTFVRIPVLLHSISSLDYAAIQQSALLILKGLSLCLQGPASLRHELISNPDFWSIVHGVQTNPEVSGDVFDLIMSIIQGTSTGVSADNYEPVIMLLHDFASAGSVGAVIEQRQDRNPRRPPSAKGVSAKEQEQVQRGMKAIQMIFQLSSRVPNLIDRSHLERTEAWTTYWSPIFGALSRQCTNPCREIRHQAFSSLQRALLSPELASPDHQEWTAIFGEVLFPLIHQLLKPEVYHSDPIGMGETRVQAATLLCKIFLHYLVLLSEWEGMLELWLRILDIMDRLMNSGQGDSLEEAVPESLKNILLVMANGGYLIPPSEDPSHAELWNETWKRLERFLPGLYGELYPDERPVTAGSGSGSAAASAANGTGNISAQDVPGSPKASREGTPRVFKDGSLTAQTEPPSRVSDVSAADTDGS